jgi:glucose/mannose-6-phosphate isomerase
MSGSLDAIRAVDSQGQLDDVLALPEHLRDALWRVESARLEAFESSGLVVCGMGGSAIGGDLAVAALGSRLSRPLTVVRGYELPSHLPPDRAVLCCSYSGHTEETIACYEAAEALGARRIVATTGGELAEAARRDGVPVIGLPAGLQPRAAVGYLFAVAAELAAHAGCGPGIRTEIDSSAAHLEEGTAAIAERAGQLAGRLEGTCPVVYGADLTAVVAYRWKCQVNENAKAPAFWGELPEIDHNEIVGWAGADPARLAAVFLHDRDHHPRVAQRFQLTARLIEGDAAAVEHVEMDGQTRTERMLWGVVLGDLVSLHLAARSGTDPSPVEVIERLKGELGSP